MPTPWEVDRGHLRTLAICHYVAGAIVIAFSSVFIIHIVLGVVFLNEPGMFDPPPRRPPGAGGSAPLPPQPGQPPPAFVGWLFIGVGSALVLLGWTTGVLTIVSGRAIARRRWRTFSLVMAGVNCMWMPVGTALGVFTFIVLLRASVAALYEQQHREAAAGRVGGAGAGAADVGGTGFSGTGGTSAARA